MSNFFSFRSLFRFNRNHDESLNRFSAVDQLIEQGANPARLEWYAFNGFPEEKVQVQGSEAALTKSEVREHVELPLAS